MAPNRYYTSYGVSTTFQTGVNNSVTTFILNGPLTNWPTSYPFTVLCDWQSGTTPEVCTITQAATGAGPYTFANVIRGVDGSSGQAHATTTGTCVPGFSARDFAEPQAHMAATAAHGIAGNVVGDTDAQALTNKTATTPSALDNSTKVSTTAYADAADTAMLTSAHTITSKRVTKRTLALSAASATPAINTDSYDVVHITAQGSTAITSFTTNLTGTPVDGDTLRISVIGSGAVALTFGASFEAGTIALPTTTVAATRLDIGFIWNTETSHWKCAGSA